jgi:dolichol-phosphate mannosyltransferase
MTGTHPPSVLVVVPTYNERDNLPLLVDGLLQHENVKVLVVDDNSPDGTGQLADELGARDPKVRVKHRPRKQGLGRAYIDTFLEVLRERDVEGTPGAGWDRIVQMDADFSHDPADVPRLLAALDAGADVAIGSRYVTGGSTVNWGLGRRLISRGGSLYARTVLGVGIRDLTAGFKAWRAATLASIPLAEIASKGYGFQVEMKYAALRRGAKIVEVPIRFVDRRIGQSKMSGTIFFEALAVVWRLRFSK